MNISPQAWDAFVKGVQGGANPAALARVMVKAFNPNQPRDDRGKWTLQGDEKPVGIPASQYSFESLKDHYTDMTGYHDPEHVTVPIKDLRASQPWVRPGTGSSTKPISGIRDKDGIIHVVDGHHRIYDAIGRGETSIRARVYDIDDVGKAFNPDEPRDTRGRWTAVEAAQATARDVSRIMDKARLDAAHNTISPETDRNNRLLSTSNLDEWSSDPIEHVQEAKDFKPGDEFYDESTPAERERYLSQLHEDLSGIHEEITGHTQKLADGLERYSQYVDAYAARVKDTLGKVKARMAQDAT